jgi:hypothetical protein
MSDPKEHRLRSARRTQRGAAFLVFVAILSTVAISFVLAEATWESKAQADRLPQQRQDRVSQAVGLVRAWYEANAPRIDNPSTPLPNAAALLAAAGVPPGWRLSAALSAAQTRGQIQYHVVVLWAENEDLQSPSFDPDTAQFTLCPNASLSCKLRAWARIEGYAIQADHLARTVKHLSALALIGQAYFKGHWLADPDHNLGVNYFRAPSDPVGCTVQSGDLPCLDGWTPIDSTSVLSVLGEPVSAGFDAWGQVIEVANANAPGTQQPLGANAGRTPFEFAFESLAPWGVPIVIFAVQPL